MCSRASWCIGRSYFVENFKTVTRDYEDEKRDFIQFRYLRLVKNLEQSTKRSGFFYYLFSTIITVVSILVPSLITIQDKTVQQDPTDEEREKHRNTIYWIVWTLSIIVTLSNAFIKLLRLDQTYISRNLRLNQLRSEGVLYLNSINEYECGDNEKFRKFIKNVEKIKNSQMQQEFTQNGEFERQDIITNKRKNGQTIIEEHHV